MKFNLRRVLLMAGAFAVLTACAQPGALQLNENEQQKFDRTVNLTLATANQIVLLADTLVNAKQISSADALNIATTAKAAKAGIDIARGLVTTQGVKVAQSRLDVAKKSVDGARDYLTTQGAQQ